MRLDSDESMSDLKIEIIKGKDFIEWIKGIEKKFDGYNLFFYKMIKVLS